MTLIKDEEWSNPSSQWYYTPDKKAEIGIAGLDDGGVYVCVRSIKELRTLYDEVLK